MGWNLGGILMLLLLGALGGWKLNNVLRRRKVHTGETWEFKYPWLFGALALLLLPHDAAAQRLIQCVASQTPHTTVCTFSVDTVVRTDTVTVTRVDTVEVPVSIRDTLYCAAVAGVITCTNKPPTAPPVEPPADTLPTPQPPDTQPTPPDTTPTTPPPGPSPGFTRVAEQGFTGACFPGWGCNYPGALKFLTEPGVTFGRLTYGTGFQAGRAPGTTQSAGFAARKASTIRVSGRFRLSSNFYGESSNTNKVLHLWLNTNTHGNRVFLSFEGKGTGPLTLQVRCQGTPNDKACAHLKPNVGNGNIPRGQWVDVTVEVCTCGTVLAWVNGQQTHGYGGLDFGAGGLVWDKVQWSPTWGGTAGVVPATMTMDAANLTVEVK